MAAGEELVCAVVIELPAARLQVITAYREKR
jgi:hypothetical protein